MIFIDIRVQVNIVLFYFLRKSKIMIMHIKNIIFKRFLHKNVELLFQSEKKHFVQLIGGFI